MQVPLIEHQSLIEPKEFPSSEEAYLWWYLKELYEAGFVTEIVHQPDSFILTEPKKVIGFGVIKPTKKPVYGFKEYAFLNGHKYTADYKVVWHESAKGIFIKRYDDEYKDEGYFWAREIDEQLVSYLDAKGSFNGPNNTSAATFPLNQKWTYDKFDIYVQKIIHVFSTKKAMKMEYHGLFVATFTPLRFLTCDVSTGKRKIAYPVLLLEGFLQIKKQEHDSKN